MTSLPYPSFHNHPPVVEKTAAALSAVGRCCIYPQSCSDGSFRTLFRNIYEKTLEQALVDDTIEDGPTREENKKLKKKFMKQSVAMAQDFIHKNLFLDPSIIDIEMVVDAQLIVETDGFVASCLLDAGCDKIVIPIQTEADLQALDKAKVSKDRLAVIFSTMEMCDSIIDLDTIKNTLTSMCDKLMIRLSYDSITKYKSSLQSFIESLNRTLSIPIHFEITSDIISNQDIMSILTLHNVTLSIIDPSAVQLGNVMASYLKTDRMDGLYTTVVCTRSGEALGLVYSSLESIIAALECGRGVYYSRSRQGLWRKGDTSGHYQDLHRIDVDCDGDALRFTVTQRGGSDGVRAFCHLNTLTCWGPPRGIRHLEQTLSSRLIDAPPGSYTKRLVEDEVLLRDKLLEEAQELSEAHDPQHVAEELADVLYFAMVKAVKAGVSIDDAVNELDKRTRKVTRRQGDSKEFRIAAAQAILFKKNTE